MFLEVASKVTGIFLPTQARLVGKNAIPLRSRPFRVFAQPGSSAGIASTHSGRFLYSRIAAVVVALQKVFSPRAEVRPPVNTRSRGFKAGRSPAPAHISLL